jgi:hypothetical protein
MPICVSFPVTGGVEKPIEAGVVFSPDVIIQAGRIRVETLYTGVQPVADCTQLTCYRGSQVQLALTGRYETPTSGEGGESSEAGQAGQGGSDPGTQLVSVPVDLTAQIESGMAYTVRGNDCANFSQLTNNRIVIPGHALASESFSVCSTGAPGNIRLNAVLSEDSRVTGTGLVPIPEAMALVTALEAGDGSRVVRAQTCGSDLREARTGQFAVEGPGVTTTDSGVYVIPAPPNPTGAGGTGPVGQAGSGGEEAAVAGPEEAGAPMQGAEAGTAGRNDSRTGGASPVPVRKLKITLIATGQTCELEL